MVRDKIVDQQIASGAKPSYRQLSVDEHKQELVKKIVEEAQEIAGSTAEQAASEIADVQQAVDDLKAIYGLTDKAVAAAQKQKNTKSGAFKKGIFVDYVEIAGNDKWVDYYRQNPDRYPEIK